MSSENLPTGEQSGSEHVALVQVHIRSYCDSQHTADLDTVYRLSADTALQNGHIGFPHGIVLAAQADSISFTLNAFQGCYGYGDEVFGCSFAG